MGDFSSLATSRDERDVNLYKKILNLDVSSRGRSGAGFRAHLNKLKEVARKRARGIEWKDIKP